MRTGAEVFSRIEGDGARQAAQRFGQLAEAASRNDRDTFRPLFEQLQAWVGSDFGTVPQEIDACPDRSLRATAKLILQGLKCGQDESCDPSPVLVAAMTQQGPAQDQAIAEGALRVIEDASPAIREAIAGAVWEHYSPEALSELHDDAVYGETVFSRLDRPACLRLAGMFSELRTAIETRDTTRLLHSQKVSLEFRSNYFRDVHRELRDHPNRSWRHEAMGYLLTMNPPLPAIPVHVPIPGLDAARSLHRLNKTQMRPTRSRG